MNCLPGDIAVIIFSTSDRNTGLVVKVERFTPEGTKWNDEMTWEVSCSVPLELGSGKFRDYAWVKDSQLQTICIGDK